MLIENLNKSMRFLLLFTAVLAATNAERRSDTLFYGDIPVKPGEPRSNAAEKERAASERTGDLPLEPSFPEDLSLLKNFISFDDGQLKGPHLPPVRPNKNRPSSKPVTHFEIKPHVHFGNSKPNNEKHHFAPPEIDHQTSVSFNNDDSFHKNEAHFEHSSRPDKPKSHIKVSLGHSSFQSSHPKDTFSSHESFDSGFHSSKPSSSFSSKEAHSFHSSPKKKFKPKDTFTESFRFPDDSHVSHGNRKPITKHVSHFPPKRIEHNPTSSSGFHSTLPLKHFSSQPTKHKQHRPPVKHQYVHKPSKPHRHPSRHRDHLHKDEKKKNTIPGIPGKDYPIFREVPDTGFSCKDVPFRPGMYANVESGCQAYHVCHDNRHGPQGASFLCTNGTLFNQKEFSCDWWYNVDCKNAISYYSLNSDPEHNPYYQKPHKEEDKHSSHEEQFNYQPSVKQVVIHRFPGRKRAPIPSKSNRNSVKSRTRPSKFPDHNFSPKSNHHTHIVNTPNNYQHFSIARTPSGSKKTKRKSSIQLNRPHKFNTRHRITENLKPQLRSNGGSEISLPIKKASSPLHRTNIKKEVSLPVKESAKQHNINSNTEIANPEKQSSKPQLIHKNKPKLISINKNQKIEDAISTAKKETIKTNSKMNQSDEKEREKVETFQIVKAKGITNTRKSKPHKQHQIKSKPTAKPSVNPKKANRFVRPQRNIKKQQVENRDHKVLPNFESPPVDFGWGEKIKS